MPLTRTTNPTPAAVSLTDLKRHLEYFDDSSHHDARLLQLATVATEIVERETSLALVNQTWVQTHRGFPLGRCHQEIRVAMRPLVSVTSISYVDSDGASQTLASSEYRVSTYGGTIEPAYDATWPTTRNVSDAVVVTYVAGHGTLRSDVPDEFRQTVLVLAGYFDAHRGDDSAEPPGELRRLIRALGSGDAFNFPGV